MVEPGLWKHRKLPVVMELLGSFFEILTIFSRPCVFWSIDAPHYSLPICPGWYWMWEPRWTSRSRCIRKSSHKPRKTPGNSHFEPKNGGLEDDFSFSNSWFSGSMLICEGVAFNDSTFEFLKKHFFSQCKLKDSENYEGGGSYICQSSLVLGSTCFFLTPDRFRRRTLIGMKQPGEILTALENSKMWLFSPSSGKIGSRKKNYKSSGRTVNRLFGICDEFMCSDFLIENQSPSLSHPLPSYLSTCPLTLTYHPQE